MSKEADDEELLELNGIDDIFLSKDIEQIVTYIAGFVVRRIVTQKVIRHCDECKYLLIDATGESTENTALIHMKNCGRLIYPTTAAREVCLAIEKCI